MPEPNESLRRARESVESPNASGEPLTRQELAELVNAWVYEHTGAAHVVEIDANYVGKLEQGKIRWPQDEDRRAGLRAVLDVDTDSELGFRRPRRDRSQEGNVDRQQFLRAVGAVSVGGAGALDTFTFIEPIRFRPRSAPSRSRRSVPQPRRSAAGTPGTAAGSSARR